MNTDFEILNGGSETTLQRVRFGQLLGPLRMALANGAAWPDDFSNDELILSRDLYDVIRAFAQLD
jgi:hypothetical protein